MWGSKGRSGYGDSTIGGDYDSWDGVSPNGKQYKNEATMETRDLSGADYWHLRKQNRPTEEIPAELHMLKNGKANIDAYADPVPTKKAPTVNIKDKILPQGKRLQTLRSQMVELEQSYKAGEMDISEYSVLRDVLVAKLQRQEVLYKKAISAKPVKTEEENEEVGVESAYSSCDVEYTHTEVAPSCGVSWIDDLPRTNSFKKPLKIACTLTRKALQFSQKARSYWNELKAV
jgi:hypothetical protein